MRAERRAYALGHHQRRIAPRLAAAAFRRASGPELCTPTSQAAVHEVQADQAVLGMVEGFGDGADDLES
jgi:hypothetical protein